MTTLQNNVCCNKYIYANVSVMLKGYVPHCYQWLPLGQGQELNTGT